MKMEHGLNGCIIFALIIGCLGADFLVLASDDWPAAGAAVVAVTGGLNGIFKQPSRNVSPHASIIGEGSSLSRITRSLIRKRAAIPQEDKDAKKLVCYYNNQAAARSGKGLLKVDKIDPFMCTHLIYGPLGMDNRGQIKSFLSKIDSDTNGGQNMLNKLSNLKRANPRLKIMLAIEEHSDKYSPMTSAPKSRSNFVKSSMDYLTKYKLDGLDLVWKYPNDPRGKIEDKDNFITLIKELKKAFKPKNYILSAALPVGEQRIQAGIDVGEMSRQLDFMNLMSYDYNGGWDNETGLHAPLHSSNKYDRNDKDKELNVEWSVKYLLEQGAEAKKMVLGITTYGRSFNLESEELKEISAPVEGLAKPGPYTKNPKLMGYNEICEAMTKEEDAWKVVRDPDYQAPYAVNGNLWISYEDAESARQKVSFALAEGLGGVAISSLDTDDFLGECMGSNKQPFPITDAVRQELGLSRGATGTPTVTPRKTYLAEDPEREKQESTGKPDVELDPEGKPNPEGKDNPEEKADPEGGTLDKKEPECGKDGKWWFQGPSCREYYDCTSGKPELKKCKEGLLWKQDKLWCDFPQNVKCKDTKQPESAINP